MKSFKFTQLLAALFAAVLFSASMFAQNVTITQAATFSGGGTFNIKGHIIDSATTTKTITGTTNLIGAAGQNIGDSAQAGVGLNFEGLTTASATAKTMKVPVAVTKKIDLQAGSLDINGHNLTIDSATAKTGGSLTAAAGKVIYDGAAGFTQTVIDATYHSLQLANNAPKVLMNAVVADTLAHAGGGLGVNKALTVNHVGTIATIDSASAVLQFAGTSSNNSIATVTTTSASGQIVNAASDTLAIATINGNNGLITTASAPLLVGALNANTGNITTTGAGNLEFTGGATNSAGGTVATSAAGAVHFASTATNAGTVQTTAAGNVSFSAAATNTGTITDSVGSGSVTFATTLANNAGGKVKGGTGGVTFTGKPTNAGTISANAGTLTFSDSTVNSGTLALTSQAHATFATGIRNSGTFSAKDTTQATLNENFNGVGTLAFTDSSRVIFQGNTSVVPSATYANLDLTGPNKTAAANDTLTGNLLLASNLEMSASKFVMTQAGSKVTGVGEIDGAVNRTHAFAVNTYYPFNKDSVGLALDAAGTPNVTITMRPDSAFATAAPSQKYAKRYYGFSAPAIGSANLKTLSLVYTNTERTAFVTDENKFGVRADSQGVWHKVNNRGGVGYTRSVDTTSNVILLAGLSTPLTGVTELGIINTAFQSIADNGNWNNGTTWDEGSAPTATDDAEIWNTGVTVSSAPAFAASLEVLSTKSLSVTANQLTVADLFNLNSGLSGGLSVSSGATVQLSSNFRINGPVTNNGTINVGN